MAPEIGPKSFGTFEKQATAIAINYYLPLRITFETQIVILESQVIQWVICY